MKPQDYTTSVILGSTHNRLPNHTKSLIGELSEQISQQIAQVFSQIDTPRLEGLLTTSMTAQLQGILLGTREHNNDLDDTSVDRVIPAQLANQIDIYGKRVAADIDYLIGKKNKRPVGAALSKTLSTLIRIYVEEKKLLKS